MHYIKDSQIIQHYKEKLNSTLNLSEYLIALIFSEQPYLAPNYDGEDADIITLIKYCGFFDKILNEKRISLKEIDIPNLEFENKYHSLISLLYEIIPIVTYNFTENRDKN